MNIVIAADSFKESMTAYEVASDVMNLLLGKDGTRYVYGLQKGTTPTTVKKLDEAMAQYAYVMKKDIGIDVENELGAGADSRFGPVCFAFLQAQLKPGIDYIMSLMNLADKIRIADLVLTDEGKIDNQTSFWKAITGIARVVKQYNVPVVALTGSDQTTEDILY